MKILALPVLTLALAASFFEPATELPAASDALEWTAPVAAGKDKKSDAGEEDEESLGLESPPQLAGKDKKDKKDKDGDEEDEESFTRS